MKKVLLTLAAGLMAFGASAAVELNVDDATNIQGTHVDEVMKEDGTGVKAAEHYQPLQSFELGGYTFTFTSTSENEGQQPAYYYATSTSSNQQKTVRIYNGTTVTITAPAGVNMTGIAFTGSNLGKNAQFTVSTGTITTENNAVWKGSANSFSLTTNATWRFSKLAITTGEGGDDPVIPTDGVIFDETLLSQESYDKFTVDNVLLPEAATYIWKQDTRYGAVASAFISGTSYASEAWLISPVVDLTDYTEAVLTFEHVGNKFPDVDFMYASCSLMARVEGGEWEKVTIPNYSDNTSWTFISAGDIALTAYEGKKMQFAYKYTSEDGKSGSWEIKNVKITAKKGAGVADIEAAEAAPVEYFNLQGVRVANPENGLYIRRQGNKVAKVLVK